MSRRIGKFPLNSGDKVVLKVDGQEAEGEVIKRRGCKVVAVGEELGKLIMRLKERKGGAVLDIEVERQDAEGRVLLNE